MMKRTLLVSVLAAVLGIGLVPLGAFANPAAERSWPHYFAVKTVMQRFYDIEREQRQARLRKVLATAAQRPPDAGRNARFAPWVYDLRNCLTGAEYTGNGKRDVTSEFADIAFDVIIWREAFARLGYPADLWRPALIDYERAQVDRAIVLSIPTSFALSSEESDATVRDMMRRLNAYHAAHPALPEIVSQGGCGGAEAVVSIATVPIAAQVMFIPTFFYELCKVQKQNANDPNGCPQWREAVEGKLQSVAGDYMYFVRWHDGVVRRGKLSFDMADDGRTITLRKP